MVWAPSCAGSTLMMSPGFRASRPPPPSSASTTVRWPQARFEHASASPRTRRWPLAASTSTTVRRVFWSQSVRLLVMPSPSPLRRPVWLEFPALYGWSDQLVKRVLAAELHVEGTGASAVPIGVGLAVLTRGIQGEPPVKQSPGFFDLASMQALEDPSVGRPIDKRPIRHRIVEAGEL